MEINIILITYNQEKYVDQAIESIFKQKIDAPIKLIIADDCSSDNTLEILRKKSSGATIEIDFLETLPTNIGMSNNYRRAFEKCNGDYTFILEGDDYWSSPFHIKQHVGFLENHWEASMSMNALILYQEEQGVFIHPNKKNVEYFNLKQQITDCNHLGNLSGCCFRTNLLKKLPDEIYQIGFADWLLGMVMAQYGLIAVLPAATSVYRQHSCGQWSGKSVEQQKQSILNCCDKYNSFFGSKYQKYFDELKQNINLKDNHQTKEKSNWLKVITDWIPPIITIIMKLIIPRIILEKVKNHHKK